jgi:hypothetical protein
MMAKKRAKLSHKGTKKSILKIFRIFFVISVVFV